MFGYVRPVRDELKCRDFDLYRAAYCGLCRCMKERCGWTSTWFLNYDFTFLALLLTPEEEPYAPCRKRCSVHPVLKKTMCPASPALELAADESVILTWWQLRDKIQDEGFWKGLPARGLSVLLRRSYRKAARHCPDFDRTVGERLGELSALERENCPSIDRTADTFARLLQAAAPSTGDPLRDRPLEELLYHLGRWIYLIDAQDDLGEDAQAARYNPVAARFGPQGDREALERTLNHSLNRMYSAAQLLSFGSRWPVIENILYLGLPLVQRAVFEGSWKQIQKQTIWRQNQ